jgi:hypothetical protein
MSKDDIQTDVRGQEPSVGPADVAYLKDLSAEDRKLAELGYVQVSSRIFPSVRARENFSAHALFAV